MEEITIKQELQGTFVKVQNNIHLNSLLEKRMLNFGSIISQCRIVMNGIRTQYRTNDITYMMQDGYDSDKPIDLITQELNKLDELLTKWYELNNDVNDSIASHVDVWNNMIDTYVNEVKFIAKNNISIVKTIDKLKNKNK